MYIQQRLKSLEKMPLLESISLRFLTFTPAKSVLECGPKIRGFHARAGNSEQTFWAVVSAWF
jgi:hypothetical protein